MAADFEVSGAATNVAKTPRFGWSIWRVTGVAAVIALLLLAFSLYRLDRTAVTVADRATGVVTETAAVQAPAEPAKAPAMPPVTAQSAEKPAPAAPPRDQGALGPIVQSLLVPAPMPAPTPAPTDAPQALPGLESALARAEAAAALATRSEPAVVEPQPAASGTGLRVFLHFTAGDPDARDKAERLARELRRRGLTVADIRAVPQSVRSSMIRFYHESDRGQLRELAAALADSARSAGTPDSWYVSDFTRHASPPRVGNVEVWIPNG